MSFGKILSSGMVPISYMNFQDLRMNPSPGSG
jgi:hypothetical protein